MNYSYMLYSFIFTSPPKKNFKTTTAIHPKLFAPNIGSIFNRHLRGLREDLPKLLCGGEALALQISEDLHRLLGPGSEAL